MKEQPISEISIRGVHKLLATGTDDSWILDFVDKLLGAIIVLSPIAFGAAALPLLGLIEPKNEIVQVVKKITRKLSDPKGADFSERATRMAAAHCLITYAAFFDTVKESFPEVWKSISSASVQDLESIRGTRSETADNNSPSERTGDLFHEPAKGNLSEITVPVPHPANSLRDNEVARRLLYEQMATGLVEFITAISPQKVNSKISQNKHRLLTELPKKACAAYEAQYLVLAQDFPEFFVWAMLSEHREAAWFSKELLQEVRLVSE